MGPLLVAWNTVTPMKPICFRPFIRVITSLVITPIVGAHLVWSVAEFERPKKTFATNLVGFEAPEVSMMVLWRTTPSTPQKQLWFWEFLYRIHVGYYPRWLVSNIFSNMGVSENSGTPKSFILIGFSVINHPSWDTPIFGNTHITPKMAEFFRNVLSWFGSQPPPSYPTWMCSCQVIFCFSSWSQGYFDVIFRS